VGVGFAGQLHVRGEVGERKWQRREQGAGQEREREGRERGRVRARGGALETRAAAEEIGTRIQRVGIAGIGAARTHAAAYSQLARGSGHEGREAGRVRLLEVPCVRLDGVELEERVEENVGGRRAGG